MVNGQKGKLIVLYGINNLGKTTQAKLLTENILINLGKNCEYLKYPIYNLEPSGSIISNYLKQGNKYKLSTREFQILQVLNRTQYQPTLKEKLDKGTWIITEDYVGTGIAWGIATGIDKNLLYKLNEHLITEDLGILFEGQSFIDGNETDNIHEKNSALLNQVATTFKEIGQDFSWESVNANQEIEKVQAEILQIIKNKITYLN